MESNVVVIPVDAHLLTLTISTPQIVERPVRVGRETRMQRERIQTTREIKTQRSAASLTLSFVEVNKIFGAADIEFRLRNTTPESVEAPKGSEALDDEGFLMLAAGFPMNNAVSLLLVRRFAGSEGGASKEKLGVCAVGDSSPDTALAHEFGHLLGLEHQGDIRDLMNPGLSAPGTPLTSSEITGARASRLFQRFGGRPSNGSS
jgi:Matrixin